MSLLAPAVPSTPNAAAEPDKKTSITTNSPIETLGRVLPAGTYSAPSGPFPASAPAGERVDPVVVVGLA